MEYKMRRVWLAADTIVSPLGITSSENYRNIRTGYTGIEPLTDFRLSEIQLQVSSLSNAPASRTSFQSICEQAISGILSDHPVNTKNTLFILSTTKGNIGLLESGKDVNPGIHLHASAKQLALQFGFQHHLVVSNACISGVMALIVAKRFIENGKYDHALVLGADVLTKFVVSGFQSLMALSSELCKPFDADRQGINLGEAAAAILLTAKPDELNSTPEIRITGGGLSNDANHISGPSRTGEELGFAVMQAMNEAKVTAREIDFISAHGTATLYNDEMEAKAFHLVGLDEVPLHSLKGNFGHTLGAAGVVETSMSMQSLLHDEILPTKGFNTLGVSQKIAVNKELLKRPLTTCLKTASGFGGCNAAIVLQKENYSTHGIF